jgi:hypothetical protein
MTGQLAFAQGFEKTVDLLLVVPAQQPGLGRVGLLVVPGEISPSWLGLTVVGPPIKVVIRVTGR